MSNKIILFADATCDLPEQFVKDNDIQIIGLRYVIGNDTDGWYTGANQKQIDEYYGRMRKGEPASTSLVVYNDAYEAFEPFFEKGCDIIHLGLSSGLAKTYENAFNAGTDLAKKYNRKFYAPDTKKVSAQSYFIMKYIVELQKKFAGKADCFERIIDALPAFYKKIEAYFTVEDLKYLHKSGRLGGVAKFIGSLLNVKPIVTCDADGKLSSCAKKTGRIASIQYIASLTENIDPENRHVIIIHADCLSDAKMLEQKVLAINPSVTTEIINMGFIIGTHTGPGTIGLGFRRK